MKLTYEENPNYQFPHWIQGTVAAPSENIGTTMDINQWTATMFGELGVKWGYERTADSTRTPASITNPVRIRLHYTDIHFFWRFKDKADAMAFKLRWDNA